MPKFEEEYQRTIESKPPEDMHWTQFELDLIHCIRDEFPIIYSNMSGMNAYQRAGKIRSAWKQISNRFEDLTATQIKTKWKAILDSYLKVKIFAESNDEKLKTKYLDGTLFFLEGANPDLYTKPNKMSKKASSSDDNENEESQVSYSIDVRQLLHEEVDLDNDGDILTEIKEEVQDISDFIHDNNPLPVPEEDIKVNKWSEDELMNATRLTKEMIDELILIKTRKYYTEPVDKV